MARRKKGLYKRGNIWWCCYKGVKENIIRESTGQVSYDNAGDFLDNRLNEVKKGLDRVNLKKQSCTFKELSDQYIECVKNQKSFYSKENIVKQLGEEFQYRELKHFNTMIVKQFQVKRLQKNKPATVNRLFATLFNMFSMAVDWNLVNSEVLKSMKKVKLLPENNKRLRYLSVEESQELINCCSEHLRPIVITALNTGMRRGEILNLQWSNVDLKHGFILLEDTKNGEPRQIPINTTLREAFLSLPRRIDDSCLFYDSNTGKPFQSVRKSFSTACRRAKLQDFRFHDLRHTFASQLVMAGIDLTTVRELLGHKTLTMTLRYAHLAPSHKVKAVNILDGVINKNSTSQLLHNLGN